MLEREERGGAPVSEVELYAAIRWDAWAGLLHRPRLCAAIVDRLTFGGYIIETDTDCYRLARTRAHAPR